MNAIPHLESYNCEFVEVDPTGRYGRYNEILGKGASKTVYRAFDEYEGIEVAWNQVKLNDFLRSPEDLQRLYCEIHLLKTLKHQNIIKLYTSWVDIANRNINFVTEMFTSGTLRQYRQKHKRVNIRAVKNWCRQILKGLLYLHSHDPPVIHRDLKCDNIFVNGSQGEVKIGDLGLAAILLKSHAAHCVGTPEFMAPEVYEEEYNELVDIYSFGMCILEMVTFEYPYSECTHPAQIYKKVISGKKPDALYKVKDPEVRQFVEKCLATVSLRLSARELLNDSFLQIDDCGSDLRPIERRREVDYLEPLLRQPLLDMDYDEKSYRNGSLNECSNDYAFDQNGRGFQQPDFEQSGIELFEYNDDDHEEHAVDIDISIKGKKREDGSIFMRLRISDRDGLIRNIYFPFDVKSDTALSVATEMVAELDITDQDVTKIADLIDGEIASLVPEWKPVPGIEKTPGFASSIFCHNCASSHTPNGSSFNMLSRNPGAKVQILNCAGNGSAATHGRFEEITYQIDSPQRCASKDANNPAVPSQSSGLHHLEIWDQHESLECSSVGSEESHCLEEHEKLDHTYLALYNRDIDEETKFSFKARNSVKQMSGSPSVTAKPLSQYLLDNYVPAIKQDLRWLKATYQMELRELRDQQLGLLPKSPKHDLCSGGSEQRTSTEIPSSSPSSANLLQGQSLRARLSMPPSSSKPFQGPNLGAPYNQQSRSDFDGHVHKCFPSWLSRWARKCRASKHSPNAEDMVTPRHSTPIHCFQTQLRTSLPVDAVDL